jgi:hypothetical protein
MRDGQALSERTRRGAWLPWALVALAACGGGGGGEGGDGTGGKSSTGGSSTSAGGSGGVAGGAGGTSAQGGSGGATGGGGASTTTTTITGDGKCEVLFADLTAKLDAAKSCTGASNQECQAFVGGLCCPEVVAEKDVPVTQAYLEALAAYQQAGCPAECPPMPCPSVNKGLCMGGSCVGFQG